MQSTNLPSSKPKGQILIAVLLIVVVAAAIAITVASRSLTEQQVTTTIDESTRALNAAEAGVEDAYRQIASGTVSSSTGTIPTARLGNQASANYSIASFGGDTKDFISPASVAQGESFQVVLSSTANNIINCNAGNYALNPAHILVFFGNGTNKFDPNTPALAVTMVYLNGGNYFNKRYILEPYAGSSRFFDPGAQVVGSGNFTPNYTSPAANNNLGRDVSFDYLHVFGFSDIPAGSNLCLMRMRPLFSSTATRIAVQPTAGRILPNQGYKITSTGQTASSNTARKLEVQSTFPAIPGIGDFVLFNGSGNSLGR